MKKKHYTIIFITFFIITFCFYSVVMALNDRIEKKDAMINYLESQNKTFLRNCR